MLQEWKVICFLAELFQTNGIKYQFDGSTTVFIHGVVFDMEDVDVYISYDSKETVLSMLNGHEMTELKNYNHVMEHCYININGVLVHAMFVFAKTDFSEEARDIVYNGVKIHTKNIEFYRRHTKKDNPLIPLIDDWLNRKNKY